MEITVHVPDDIIAAAVIQSVRSAFSNEAYTPGVGISEVRRQVHEYVRSLDFGPLIEEFAPGIMREAIRNELAAAIKQEVKRQVKLVKDNGDLALFSVE